MLSRSILLAFLLVGAAHAEFSLGVASGDPTETAVMVWTRTDAPRAVTLQVARDESFAQVEQTIAAESSADADNTLKIDVRGLSPGTGYFYRFVATDNPLERSDVGFFHTAPTASIARPLRFVFSGDTNYATAPFGVVAGIPAEGADFFIWFGDTIYGDVPAGGLGVARTLDDYRAKHRQVRGDPSIRAALRALPILVGGDDHEVRNDYAGNDPAVPVEQRSAGYQALLEYMPLREAGVADDPQRTYRSLRYGALAEFFLLDGRQYRDASAAAACNSNPDPYGLYLGLLSFDADCIGELFGEQSMLGAEQLEWLKSGLSSSTARWKFVVNNVPMSFIGVAPYDRWDGYVRERDELLRFIHAEHIDGVVILTTDIHANGYNPDVSRDAARALRIPELRGDLRVPEVIVGPLGNQTAYGTIASAAGALLGGLGDFAAVGAFVQVAIRLRLIDGMEFVQPNRVSYVVIDVDSAESIEVRFRGTTPERANDAEAGLETFKTVTIDAEPSASALPCGLPALSIALLLAFAGRGRRCKSKASRGDRSD